MIIYNDHCFQQKKKKNVPTNSQKKKKKQPLLILCLKALEVQGKAELILMGGDDDGVKFLVAG